MAGTQSSGINISSSGGISGGGRGVRSASGRGAVKPTLKGKLVEPKSGVKVLPNKTAPKSGLENRGNKITIESQKNAAKKLIQDDRNRIMNSKSVDYFDSTFRGPSKKTILKNKPVSIAANKKSPIKINSQRNLKKK